MLIGFWSEFRAYLKLEFGAKPMFKNGSKSALSKFSFGAWDY